jgi:hypothetical protein
VAAPARIELIATALLDEAHERALELIRQAISRQAASR